MCHRLDHWQHYIWVKRGTMFICTSIEMVIQASLLRNKIIENVTILFCLSADIRSSELVQGRSINLALSVRGRKALADVGLEQQLLQHGIPMRGRMLHAIDGRTTVVPYDPNTNQVN